MNFSQVSIRPLGLVFLLKTDLFMLANSFLQAINNFLFMYREKEKVKEREDAWLKIGTMAKSNPQVCRVKIFYLWFVVCLVHLALF